MGVFLIVKTESAKISMGGGGYSWVVKTRGAEICLNFNSWGTWEMGEGLGVGCWGGQVLGGWVLGGSGVGGSGVEGSGGGILG